MTQGSPLNSSPKFLQYIDFPDWVKEDVPGGGFELEPLKHTVHIHDFAMLACHDVACPVCMNAPAIFWRNMTPGEYQEGFKPCKSCQTNGWMIIKIPKFLRKLLVFLDLIEEP